MSGVPVKEHDLATSPDAAFDVRYQSWGRYPRVAHRRVSKVYWRDHLPDVLRNAEPASLLPYGLGRSYGDSCLNEHRDLLDCSPLNRILHFDWTFGRVRLEGGVTFGDLLQVIVPHGWFLPVTPGTKFVTIGGAIANDVHGKNHHRAGTFGCHVEGLMLYRSDAKPIFCSPKENADLFKATIGGLGLTGVIGWADVKLKRIDGNAIESQALPFKSLEKFVALSAESDQNFEYTVAWIDCLAGKNTRGIFFRGNHVQADVRPPSRTVTLPCVLPEFLLNRSALGLFNGAYYGLKSRKSQSSLTHYDPFFYPLDSLLKWNLLYGKRGFVQYQFVVPLENLNALSAAIQLVSASNHGCFLAVLKAFGNLRSPGLLSFPRPGFTLTLDVPMRGASTLRLLDMLDQLVLANCGALYPAKDARMSSKMFAASFPHWRRLVPFIDPKCSSSFWRRVTNG